MTIYYLIGLPGVGKTTLGTAVCKALGPKARFVDLDQYIEGQCRASISDIFAQHGEAEFRRIEGQALRDVADNIVADTIIIGCGGGTPCFGDNGEFMHSAGTVVWLQASNQRLTERLLLAQAQRPLIASKTPEQVAEYIQRTAEARAPHYAAAAHHTFDASRLEDVQQIASTVRAFIEEIIERG